jgi:hypothetical protein
LLQNSLTCLDGLTVDGTRLLQSSGRGVSGTNKLRVSVRVRHCRELDLRRRQVSP